MINPKIIGMMLVVTAAASALISLQNPVKATVTGGPEEQVQADVDVEEAVSENATMMTNQTEDGNMIGTNSAS